MSQSNLLTHRGEGTADGGRSERFSPSEENAGNNKVEEMREKSLSSYLESAGNGSFIHTED